ncbi:hypothetical protein MCSF7_03143 [Mycoplasmopsis columbina SF7]|uniref:Ribosome maturation factor RimP C-terminal domain-containing protein n=1 Tax=Mycoplasmopsis columbina SF7 TaxID=1037410 RepID=F9UJH0_9BACT|nr:ribosome assembly cofactor RimP [Mycoplasmopsis columbina]EGV00513.1 hypothetical protein MCSF7_03143 [Mycoplasmopsis columbina SF7]
MNWKEILQKEFGNDVFDAKIEKEDGITFLFVTSNYSDMNQVEELAKKISDFLNLNYENKMNFDSLSVQSKGVKLVYEIDELGELINEFIEVNLIKNLNKQEKFIGKLLEVNEDSILVEWNAKGQFRKQVIEKTNIKKVEKHIKF